MDKITNRASDLLPSSTENPWPEISMGLALSAMPAGGKVAGSEEQRLQQQILKHEENNRQKSYLQRTTESVTDLFWNRDRDSLNAMRQRLEGKTSAGIDRLIQEDTAALTRQNEINQYSTGFLKTMALFMKGKEATGIYVGLSALDQTRPSDSFADQMKDLALGGAKAGLMRATFAYLGDAKVGIAGRAVGLSVASQFLENTLNRRTYRDPETGDFDLGLGVKRIAMATLDPAAIATNLLVFGSAYGMQRGIDAMTNGALKANPFLSTVLTGGTMGFSSGTVSELARQRANNEDFNYWSAAKRGLLQGTLDGIAAVPGGIQSSPTIMSKEFPKSFAEFRDQISLARWNLAAYFSWSPIPLVITAPADRAYDLVEKGQLERAHKLGKAHFEIVEKHLGELNSTSARRADYLTWAFERAGDFDKAAYYKKILVDSDARSEIKTMGAVSSRTLGEIDSLNDYRVKHFTAERAAAGIRETVDLNVKHSNENMPTAKADLGKALDRYALWFTNNGFADDAKRTLAAADTAWKTVKGGRDAAVLDANWDYRGTPYSRHWLFNPPGVSQSALTESGINTNIRSKLE